MTNTQYIAYTLTRLRTTGIMYDFKVNKNSIDELMIHTLNKTMKCKTTIKQ